MLSNLIAFNQFHLINEHVAMCGNFLLCSILVRTNACEKFVPDDRNAEKPFNCNAF